MRPLPVKAALAALLSATLLVTTPALSASAASRPGQVGLVSFVGASVSSSSATLTVDWSDVAGAKKYEVFASTSYDALPKKTSPSATVTASKATITGLSKGKDYFVQVRAVNSAGNGPRSWRVGHRSMVSEATAAATRLRAVTWNVCSYQCSGIVSRAKVIKSRIAELKADVVGFQEASKVNVAPSGYAFAYNGQNDILYRKAAFTKVAAKSGGPTSGYARAGKKHASPGQGFAWAALKSSAGQYMVVVSAHLLVGTKGAALKQREYEASRLQPFISRQLASLQKSHGSLTDWTNAPVIVLGDTNTQKGRTGDDTLAILEKAGWHDAFEQAHSLTRQHHSTANSEMSTKPQVGITWGAHIDKVLVRPSRTIVYKWANAGEMSGSRYVTPLGSDHHPLLVELAVR
ncbi:endonuclease/exonuclease/phosphatase family protein [Microbacterium sp. 179-B 1A2 NHS]|uniref:endonuclease/exonuclease/phosphatase family protein n=1 Tax=Microbacterium sp. 179-B 1A2 NHS TaxID=3142383 RepID=UPI0039A32F78